jgi:hypothetical protein
MTNQTIGNVWGLLLLGNSRSVVYILELNMQIYTSSPRHYIPIIPLSIYCLICNFSVSHTISILILTLIFSVGVSEEGYYNMALSLLLCLICLMHNIESVYAELIKTMTHGMVNFVVSVVGDGKMYLLMMETVGLVILVVECLRRYKKYRAEAHEASQW